MNKSTQVATALCEQAEGLRHKATNKLDRKKRAMQGQFMTPANVAGFLASIFGKRDQRVIRLLDAGAGVGGLSASFVAEMCSRRHRPEEISITAYEIDPQLVEYLGLTLDACHRYCEELGIDFRAEVRQEDFVKAGVSIVQGGVFTRDERKFNYAILNPPYQKIHSASEHRQYLRQAGIETSNLYTAFLALVAELLEPEGELVAITPRSFCNGRYFRSFRKSFLELMRLQRIHIFDSRSSAFKDDKVLQENIIFHALKSGGMDSHRVTISSSADADTTPSVVRSVDSKEVVLPGDSERIIHIPVNEVASEVSDRVRTLSATLDTLGITVSTGRVVDFRARELTRMEAGDGMVPLIYPRNLTEGSVSWPLPNGKKPKAVVDTEESQRLLVPSGFYVLTKRFTSKEERRRVVAAVYDPSVIKAKRVGFENHLNYFHHKGEGLPRTLARGLAVFLNSSLVDTFFRVFNGHTQVNATDLRRLQYPSRDQLETFGAVIADDMPDQEELDRLVERELQ